MSGRDRVLVNSPTAWLRLAAAVAIGTIGGVGLWSIVVIVPALEAEFGISRADASLPYSLTMLGFGAGGVVLGRLADRSGIFVPALVGALLLPLGYVASAFATAAWQLALVFALVGFASSAGFSPMMSDITRWFDRRRGIAVAAAASGNYVAGAVWPPIVQHATAAYGWRATHLGIAAFCLLTLVPLAFAIRRPAPAAASATAAVAANRALADTGLSSRTLMVLLSVAGLSCCIAMSMPQVHIVAYCGELGYGVARGAEMLSLMLAFGIVSRVGSGFLADRIGGVGTLLIGSALQGVALLLYLMFDGLTSLYVVSALFGLFQGGIVPSYALIVREFFPPQEAGTRTGIVIMATLVGMSLGGWLSGAIFDLTHSYRAAFAHGMFWNGLNLAIALYLLRRPKPKPTPTLAPA